MLFSKIPTGDFFDFIKILLFDATYVWNIKTRIEFENFINKKERARRLNLYDFWNMLFTDLLAF